AHHRQGAAQAAGWWLLSSQQWLHCRVLSACGVRRTRTLRVNGAPVAAVTGCTVSARDLSNCTVLMAEALSCPWPSPALDSFFLQIHMEYFTNCTVPASSQPSQPPLGPVLAMAAVPACLTPLLVALTLRKAREWGLV
uniref:Receptor activity modifying protein 1 n=1 Tax=Chrysemys picta bellii TaxID=8478 RepID=A0A8C3F1E3_CHRPI